MNIPEKYARPYDNTLYHSEQLSIAANRAAQAGDDDVAAELYKDCHLDYFKANIYYAETYGCKKYLAEILKKRAEYEKAIADISN